MTRNARLALAACLRYCPAENTGVTKLSGRYETRTSALCEADEVRAAPDEQHVVDALHPLAAHVALVLPRELRDPVEAQDGPEKSRLASLRLSLPVPR